MGKGHNAHTPTLKKSLLGPDQIYGIQEEGVKRLCVVHAFVLDVGGHTKSIALLKFYLLSLRVKMINFQVKSPQRFH